MIHLNKRKKTLMIMNILYVQISCTYFICYLSPNNDDKWEAILEYVLKDRQMVVIKGKEKGQDNWINLITIEFYHNEYLKGLFFS